MHQPGTARMLMPLPEVGTGNVSHLATPQVDRLEYIRESVILAIVGSHDRLWRTGAVLRLLGHLPSSLP
jgi:hypothetical protein